MFKFNFTRVDDSIDDNFDQPHTHNEKEEIQNCSGFCEEIVCNDMEVEKFIFKPVTVENVNLFIRDFENENDNVDEFLSKYYKSCDVTPSVYEGGLKVWECTYDLLLYLLHNETNFRNKTVLDLGCGCGLLGMYAAQQGAKIVHFHDYNSDVLKKFTAPNVLKNQIKSNTRFLSGDWSLFCDLLAVQNISYDFILTSETLYNTNNYSNLCRIFGEKLNKKGEIILASKTYYFGVGGNTKQFLEFLDREQKFKWEVAWKNSEGVQREIISIMFK